MFPSIDLEGLNFCLGFDFGCEIRMATMISVHRSTAFEIEVLVVIFPFQID